MCSHRLSPSCSSWPVNARHRGERAFDQMLLEATGVLLYTTIFCPSAPRKPMGLQGPVGEMKGWEDASQSSCSQPEGFSWG